MSTIDRLPLLILGASARAAAQSARRAGFDPIGVDLFADLDLSRRFRAYRVEPSDYPNGLFDVAERLPDAPWIYTGALENDPSLIDALASKRRLLGISGDALRASRSPKRWTEVLQAAGSPTANVLDSDDPPPRSGDWLAKPLASAAGREIAAWSIGSGIIRPGTYLQRRLHGPSIGATFVGDGRSSRFVGAARQLLRRNEAGLAVAYQGSVGPWPVGPGTRRRLERMGDALVASFELRGLFGIDAILTKNGPIAVEINPRYTASVEVLEEGLGRSLFAEHARAFGIEPTAPPSRSSVARIVAKRILFADRPLIFAADLTSLAARDRLPGIADIPAVGTSFSPGEPILTVFGRGRSIASALARLDRRSFDWRRRIHENATTRLF